MVERDGVGRAGNIHGAAHGLRRQIIGRTHGVGTGLAKARHRGVNHVGIELFAGLHTKAQAVHNAGPVVFQQNVCRFDKLGKKSLSFGGLEVQRNGLLSAVDVGKVGGKCAHARLPHTRRVALGALHFNNFGPHVGQVRAAQRPCDSLGKVDYTDSVQNTLFHAITPLFLGAPLKGPVSPFFPIFVSSFLRCPHLKNIISHNFSHGQRRASHKTTFDNILEQAALRIPCARAIS